MTEAANRGYSNDAFRQQIRGLPAGIKNVNGIEIIAGITTHGFNTQSENVVYIGQTAQRTVVALKLALSSQASVYDKRKQEEQFQNQAAAASPYVVPVEFGTISLPFTEIGSKETQTGDFPYLVTPFFAGGTLQQAIPRKKGITTDELLLRGAYPVARAIDTIGSLGMVHADIKSENVLMNTHGNLTDFGIAVFAGRWTNNDNKTYGTITSMAPEQFQSPTQLYPAVDIYGGTALLVNLLDGEKLIRAVDIYRIDEDVRLQNASYKPYLDNRLKRFSLPVQDVIRHGVARDPNDRPATFMEVFDGLMGAVAKSTATVIDTGRHHNLATSGALFDGTHRYQPIQQFQQKSGLDGMKTRLSEFRGLITGKRD